MGDGETEGNRREEAEKREAEKERRAGGKCVGKIEGSVISEEKETFEQGKKRGREGWVMGQLESIRGG